MTSTSTAVNAPIPTSALNQGERLLGRDLGGGSAPYVGVVLDELNLAVLFAGQHSTIFGVRRSAVYAD